MIDQKRIMSSAMEMPYSFAVGVYARHLGLCLLAASVGMVLGTRAIPTVDLILPVWLAIGLYSLSTGGLMVEVAESSAEIGRRTSINRRIASLALLAWAVLVLALMVNWYSAGFTSLALFCTLSTGWSHSQRRGSVLLLAFGVGISLPILIGWTAAANALAPQAFVMAAPLFYWIWPYSRALRLIKRTGDVVAGAKGPSKGRESTSTLAMYILQLLLLSLVPALLSVAPQAPVLVKTIYLGAVLIIGIIGVALTIRVVRAPVTATLSVLYQYLTVFPLLLMAAAIADRLLL